MSQVNVTAWKCDVCGAVWLDDEKPVRCRKCKARTWDNGKIEESAVVGPCTACASKDKQIAALKAEKAVKDRATIPQERLRGKRTTSSTSENVPPNRER